MLECLGEDPYGIVTVVKVISGGQTGADMGAVRGAARAGVATGGWMPKGFRIEGHPGHRHPVDAAKYGFREHTSSDYPPRTFANVRDSDGTIRFAIKFDSPGEALTLVAIQQYKKAHLDMEPFCDIRRAANIVRGWTAHHNVRVLNVAGHRESACRGIEAWVEEVVAAVFA